MPTIPPDPSRNDQEPAGRATRPGSPDLSRFFDLSQDLLAVVSPATGHFERINPAFTEDLGWAEADLLAMTFLDLVHPDDRDRSAQNTRDLDARRQAGQFENRVRGRDGGYRWISWTATLQPETGRIYCVGRDVTGRRREMARLAREQELLRSIVDSIPVMLVTWDPALRRFTLNRHATEVLGWTTEDANGAGDFMASVYPDPVYRAEVAAYMQSLDPGWREWLCASKGGQRIPIDWSNVRLTDETMVGIGVDLRAHKAAAEALRESEQRLRMVLENSRDGIHQFDLRRKKYVYMSPAQERLTGFSLDELEGLTEAEAAARLHPDDRPAVDDYLARLVAGERPPEPVQYRWRIKSGEYRWFSDSRELIRDERGEPLALVGVSRDITEQKEAQAALERLTAELEQHVTSRTAEVRAQADQLRALAIRLSWAELSERRRLARVLHDHLQQLLVSARIQLGWIRRKRDPVQIRATVQGVDSILKDALRASRDLTLDLSPPAVHESGLIGGLQWLAASMLERSQFTVDVQADEQAEPHSEELRFLLFECARELLFNALKHSGTTAAEVSLAPAGDGLLTLAVTDRGRGFDPDLLRDRRPDASTFGLFSIQERLRHLGGEMKIESGAGQGTRVTLVAPLGEAVSPGAALGAPRAAPAAERQASPRTRTHGAPRDGTAASASERAEPVDRCRIVIVDDHRIIREGLSGLLELEPDMEVVGEAADGWQAIELADQLRPDVVIMDVNLDGLDGLTATRRIRAAHPAVQVVGLSMHVEDSIARAMREAGAAAYLSKGGPSEDLVEAIRACRA